MTTDQPRTGDTITTADQLDALPNSTVIHDAGQDTLERHGHVEDKDGNHHSAWLAVLPPTFRTGSEVDLPVTVLYVPGEQPRPSVEDAHAERIALAASRVVPSDQATAEDYVRSTAVAVGLDPDHAVTQWREQVERNEEMWAASRAVPSDQDSLQRLARAAFAVDSKHHFHGSTCICGFNSFGRARSATEHITAAVLEEYDHD